MNCPNCQKEIAENSNFCYFCGAKQSTSVPAGPPKRLLRSATDRTLGGVCAGFAEYLGGDPTLIRLLYIVLTFFTGIIPGVVAYLVAWMVMPEASFSAGNSPARPSRRLLRSATDSKIGGVCGGLGEFLGVDSTMIRLIWAILSVLPGGIVGGIVAYVIAWIIIPLAPQALPARAAEPSTPAPQHN